MLWKKHNVQIWKLANVKMTSYTKSRFQVFDIPYFSNFHIFKFFWHSIPGNSIWTKIIAMDENQKRPNMDTPSESQGKRTNNLRDAEEDSIRERRDPSKQIQSDAPEKAFYQAPEEFKRDNSRDPQQDNRATTSKMADRDAKNDEYRNNKLSDTEMGGE